MRQWTDEAGSPRWVRKERQGAQADQLLYDLFVHGDHPGDDFPPLVRTPIDQLQAMVEAIVSSEGALALLYPLS
jgi:hypothetical protein